MNDPSRPSRAGRPLTPEQRYWQLWRSGRRPDLATFLAALTDPSPADASSVVGVDQYERWSAGERVSAEDYVALLPAGEGHEQAVCDVVYGEYLLREQLGERPLADEYLRRFPALSEALSRQIALHHALADQAPAPTVSSSSPGADVPPPAIPGYLVYEEVGRGGMGVVYRARQNSLDRDVALKVMRVPPGRDTSALDRIRREAHLTGRLSHPHIVTVFDAGMVGEWFYIAMEFVSGIDLHRLVDQSGPMAPARAADYLRQAALGLQYAYEQGLVHRDVKPSNLIVTRQKGPSPSVLKVLDLGLARSGGVVPRDDPITQVGTFMGTPEFVAPEQANDPRAADVRSDLYSLGCTFYFVLTGRVPFEGATPFAKLVRHHVGDAPRLDGLPQGLAGVIERLMARQPEARYQTPSELVAALDALAGRRAEPPPTARVELARRLGAPAWVKGVAFSPDGRSVASGGVDGSPRLWDAASGEAWWAGPAGAAVLCVCFVGGHLAAGGEDGSLSLWDVVAGRLLWRSAGHAENVNAVAAAGGRLLTGGHDGTVRLWDAATGAALAVWRGHAGPVWGVASDAEGRLAASGGQDGVVRLWDVARGQATSWPALGAVVGCVALTADGRHVAAGDADGGVRLCESAGGREVARLVGHGSRVTAVAWSPDGRRVLTGCRDQTARLFFADGAVVASLAGHGSWVTSVAWSPDGRAAATGGRDHSVGVWRMGG